ncbi:MAG TPA: hypothetical protein VM347_05860 [Nonomuraea sp.]|nr:hypothetical protein [Nonomuraea sp.]
MRVLIIGGGSAGTIAAMAVQKAGHEPVVYEAGLTPPAQGASAPLEKETC